MSHKIGDRASCGDCGRLLVYTKSGWDHAGLNKPRHIARPVGVAIDDSDLDDNPGIVLAYHDAPEDEPETPPLPQSVDALYKHLHAQLSASQRTMLQALVILLRDNPERHQENDGEREPSD